MQLAMPQPGRAAAVLAALAAALPGASGAFLSSSDVAVNSLKDGAEIEALTGNEAAMQAWQMSGVTIPPDFWMWKTTPPPPIPPGPNPQLIWVEQTAPPLPTTPPMYDQCYGCDCVVAFPGGFLTGGDISNRYTCHGGGSKADVPEFNWGGMPQNSGQGHPINQADGTTCTKSQSFAITMEDMDWPNGVGESTNSIKPVFWAINIPGDWTELTEELAHRTYKDIPIVTIGQMGNAPGLDRPCPKKGVHRYKITLWALKTYIGSETNPVDPTTDYSTIVGELEGIELARHAFFGNVKAPGYSPSLFLQKATSWLRHES